MRFFATCARALEPLLADELRTFGATSIEPTRAGVSFEGNLGAAYRACLWSRVASRILLPLASFEARTPEALYAGVQRINWSDHLAPRRTLAVDCSISQSAIDHSHYAALKTKDAVVDQLRARRGSRPDVDVERPDVRINVYVHQDRATVSIDLSGESQHRRGYRVKGAAAPLKENLASAVLLLAEWPRRAAERQPLVDPMCGSGTLLTEASQIAGDVAPGLQRTHFGCLGWGGHDAALWGELRREAEQRARAGARRRPQILGYDADARAVRAAADNAARAGLADRIRVEKRRLTDCAPPDGVPAGLLVTNPPYGVRLGEEKQLESVYAELGDVMRHRFLGWSGFVLTGSSALAKRIGLRPARRIPLWNGAIECRLLEFPISADPVKESAGPHWRR